MPVPQDGTIAVTAMMAAVVILVDPGLSVECELQASLASTGRDAPGGVLGGHAGAPIRLSEPP